MDQQAGGHGLGVVHRQQKLKQIIGVRQVGEDPGVRDAVEKRDQLRIGGVHMDIKAPQGKYTLPYLAGLGADKAAPPDGVLRFVDDGAAVDLLRKELQLIKSGGPFMGGRMLLGVEKAVCHNIKTGAGEFSKSGYIHNGHPKARI